jgi:hypothetical protein
MREGVPVVKEQVVTVIEGVREEAIVNEAGLLKVGESRGGYVGDSRYVARDQPPIPPLPLSSGLA